MATAEKTLAATGTVENRAASGRKGKGMTVPRVFSTEGVSPYDQVDWEFRTAAIKDERGKVIFEQVDCEIPRAWSQLATNVVVSKYFYGEVNTRSASRASATWSTASRGPSPTGAARTATSPRPRMPTRFYDELSALCLNQYGSFNSPVWFNVGLFHRYGIEGAANNWRWDEETRGVVQGRQAPTSTRKGSACFIQSVDDDMERHHAAGPLRGHAVQVRLGHRLRPLHPAVQPREALRRRQAVAARSASCGCTTRSPAW